MRADDVSEKLASRESSASTHSTIEIIEVLEERLRIVKQVVDSGGGLRLRKVVHSNSVNVAEPLEYQSLDVKRISIGREIDSAPAIRYEGDVTVFPIIEERLITRKQLVLVEEVHVTKVSRVDRTSQQVALRREEIIVERQDPTSGEWSVVGSESAMPASL